jgi:AcrR family transcriptional regulator
MTAAGSAPTAGERGEGLSRDAIVVAAAAVARRQGFESVSMRGLAREFGVTAMAIHYHVPTREALLQLVAEHVLSSIEPAPDDGPWDERLRRVHENVGRVVGEYPGLATYLVGHRAVPSAVRFTDMSTAILLDAGFDERTVVLAQATTVSYWMGFLQLRPQFEGRRRHEPGKVAGGSPGHPHLDQVAAARRELAADEYPRFAIDTIIAGLRQLLAGGRHGPQPRSTS